MFGSIPSDGLGMLQCYISLCEQLLCFPYFDSPISPPHRGSSFPALGTESQTGLPAQNEHIYGSVLDHMYVSDSVLLLLGLLQQYCAILQVWLGDVQSMRESQICLIWKMECIKDYVHTREEW